MSDTPRRPLLINLDEAPPSPADAPPVPDDLPVARAMLAAERVVRPSGWARLGWAVLVAFAGFVASVMLWDFVANLLARNSILGAVAMALAAGVILVLTVAALREVMAYARLGRLDTLRARTTAARTAPLREARAAAAAVAALYAHRPEMSAPLARVSDQLDEVMDPDAVIDLTERHLMAPLDLAARREIELAARQVALATAFIPLALADVAAALWANLRMVRRLAAIYGGRAGSLGSWRLLRRVFSHLVATGALALSDDLISSIAGGGLLSKLSRRFGEGVVNGALTARVGVAAMEVCRPMPFVALPAPKVSNLVSRGLAGLFDRG